MEALTSREQELEYCLRELWKMIEHGELIRLRMPSSSGFCNSYPMPLSSDWPKTMRADKQLTAAAGFTDPRSFVAPDGREVLYAADWEKRKLLLWERAGGRCEYTEPMTAFATEMWRCNREGQIPAHVIPRYPRRDDRLSNLKCYCVEHDRLTERQSWRKTRFGEKAAGRP